MFKIVEMENFIIAKSLQKHWYLVQVLVGFFRMLKVPMDHTPCAYSWRQA